MKDFGHVTLWDSDCVYIIEDDEISIIPKNEDDIKNFRKHFDDQNFIFKYAKPSGFKYYYFIDRVQYELTHSVKLFPLYSINECIKESFAGFEITGEALDEFFQPSRYFFDRSKNNNDTNIDLIYNNEIAEQWTIRFKDNFINITLSYGDILQQGIVSDLKLHPKLTVEFESTSDIQYVYQVYSILIRFIRLINYDTRCGVFQITLFSKEKEKLSHNGYLYDYCISKDYCRPSYNVEYSYYKPYIGRFLQFAADNPKYTYHHFPRNGIRYRGRHYSSIDFLNIFAAFESECHANAVLFENVDTTKIDEIKKSIVSLIESYPTTKLKPEEKNFLNNSRDCLLKLGTEFGQRKKIKNAYQVLHQALDGSIESIFFLPEFKCMDHLSSKQLNTIVEFLVGQRGAIAHGNFHSNFSDVDAQKIHFLEILTYAQLLKRVGLDDKDIERVIGVLFGCNYILFQEKYDLQKE